MDPELLMPSSELTETVFERKRGRSESHIAHWAQCTKDTNIELAKTWARGRFLQLWYSSIRALDWAGF